VSGAQQQCRCYYRHVPVCAPPHSSPSAVATPSPPCAAHGAEGGVAGSLARVGGAPRVPVTSAVREVGVQAGGGRHGVTTVWSRAANVPQACAQRNPVAAAFSSSNYTGGVLVAGAVGVVRVVTNTVTVPKGVSRGQRQGAAHPRRGRRQRTAAPPPVGSRASSSTMGRAISAG